MLKRKLEKLRKKLIFSNKVRKEIASKNTARVIMSVLLSACCIGVASCNTYAKNATGTLGVCNIANPTYNSSGSTYNYVYFGDIPNDTTNYDSNAVGKPILWRVLNTTANDDNGTPALFMLTEYGISTKAWDENNSGSSDSYRTCGQIWDDYYATVSGYNSSYGLTRASTVRGFLQGIESGGVSTYNGAGMYQKCFDPAEKEAIMTTVKTSETMEVKTDTCNPTSIDDTRIAEAGTSSKINWYSSSYYAYGCPLRGDTIFLLSAKEATNANYGFEADNYYVSGTMYKNRLCKQYASARSNSCCWLRSGCSANYTGVAPVREDGAGDYYGSNISDVALRTALNLTGE